MEINAGDTIITATTTSYESIGTDLVSKKKTSKFLLLFSLTAFLASTLSMVIFFPFTFIRDKNFQVSGNVNLINNDFIFLSKAKKMDSWIFANTDKMAENINNNGSVLINNSYFDKSGFYPTLIVDEKIPRAKLFNEAYLDCKNTFSTLSEKIDSLNISKDRLEIVKKQIQDEVNLVPQIAINIDESSLNENQINEIAEKTITPLLNVPFKSISAFEFLNYHYIENDSENDSQISNKMDAVVNYENDRYLIKDFDSDNFSKFFSSNSFPQALMRDIKNKINDTNGAITIQNFILENGVEIDAYPLKLLLKNENSISIELG